MADADDLATKIVPGTVLAAVLGVTDRRIRQLRDEGFIPEGPEGYELGAAVRGYCRFLGARKPARDTEHTRLASAQAEKVERANLREDGKLLPIGVVDETLQGLVTAAVGELEGLPRRLANELAGLSDPALVLTRLREECRAIRTSLAVQLEARADSLRPVPDGGVDDAPAAGEKPGGVGGREPDISSGERGAGALPQSANSVLHSDPGGLRDAAL